MSKDGKPEEICVNMVAKDWYPVRDPWDRVMCDWETGTQTFTARDGNEVNMGKNHPIQLPSSKIWNTTIAGKIVRLIGPIQGGFNVAPHSMT